MKKLKDLFMKIKKKIKSVKNIKIIMIALIIIILISIISLRVFNDLNTPKTLKNHLKELGFKQDKNGCYYKKVKDEVPFLEDVKVCYNECQYYIEEGGTRTAINMNNLDVEYSDFSKYMVWGNVNKPDELVCKPYYGATTKNVIEHEGYYDEFCNIQLNRVKVFMNSFKNIVEDYSLKCKPKIKSSSILDVDLIDIGEDKPVTIDELKERDKEYFEEHPSN